MAKFIKKADNGEALVSEYVDINGKIKELEARAKELKPLVLAAVKNHEGVMVAGGMQVVISARPKLKYSEALEAEIKKAKEAQDFVDLKCKRAREDHEYTIIDPGEFVTVKKLAGA